MIYTTYFSKLKNLPDNIIPVSICLYPPKWFHGIQYKKLAPKEEFFHAWKNSHDNRYFINQFYSKVLNSLDPYKVEEELSTLITYIKENKEAFHYKSKYDPIIALVCWESSNTFCHRHIVREWFTRNGIECLEYQ